MSDSGCTKRHAKSSSPGRLLGEWRLYIIMVFGVADGMSAEQENNHPEGWLKFQKMMKVVFVGLLYIYLNTKQIHCSKIVKIG